MQLEDYLNQTVGTSSLGRSKSRPAMSNQARISTPRQDTVTISSAARAAQSQLAGTAGNQAEAKADSPAPPAAPKPAETFGNPADANTDSPVVKELKIFMDKLLGRGLMSGPKSLKEKIKDITEKIKKLNTQLSEVMTSTKISDSVKSNQIQSISSRIRGLEMELAELGKQAAEEAQED
jgi:hypothetical protein